MGNELTVANLENTTMNGNMANKALKAEKQRREFGAAAHEADIYNHVVLGEGAAKRALMALVEGYDGPVQDCGIGYARSVKRPKKFTAKPRHKDLKPGDWRTYYVDSKSELIRG